MEVSYSKAEVKSFIKKELKEKWQELWDKDGKGWFYYNIQRKVGEMRGSTGNRKEQDVVSRLRFGHAVLNSTLIYLKILV